MDINLLMVIFIVLARALFALLTSQSVRAQFWWHVHCLRMVRWINRHIDLYKMAGRTDWLARLTRWVHKPYTDWIVLPCIFILGGLTIAPFIGITHSILTFTALLISVFIVALATSPGALRERIRQ